MRKWLGLDAVEVAIHVFVTICAAVMLGEASGSSDDVVVPMVFGASAIVFSIRRRVALRKQPPEFAAGQIQAEHLADLEARVADLEQVHYRVAELEERLDFSERLLAQQTRGTEARVPGQDLH